MNLKKKIFAFSEPFYHPVYYLNQSTQILLLVLTDLIICMLYYLDNKGYTQPNSDVQVHLAV